jgi:hypothetical protein
MLKGGNMDHHPHSFRTIVGQPSAFLPMAMSLAALALVLGSVAMFGVVHGTDEGAIAHLWQVAVVGEKSQFHQQSSFWVIVGEIARL